MKTWDERTLDNVELAHLDNDRSRLEDNSRVEATTVGPWEVVGEDKLHVAVDDESLDNSVLDVPWTVDFDFDLVLVLSVGSLESRWAVHWQDKAEWVLVLASRELVLEIGKD